MPRYYTRYPYNPRPRDYRNREEDAFQRGVRAGQRRRGRPRY